MKLGSLIDKECILVGGTFKSVEAATDRLIDIFSKKKKLPMPADDVREVVRERERLGGTVLPTGIAVPHGRIDGFQDLLIGVWVPESPIEDAGGTVKAVFFSLTSKSGTALYLPAVAALAKFSQDETAFSLLQKAKGRTAVKDILDGINLKREITVEDIMTKDPITCGIDTTLAELTDLFYQKGLSYVPVVDADHMQIGEVTVKDLLSRGIPDYVRRLENTRFLKTLEPFEALLSEEDRIPVKDVMRKPSRSITPDASIIEAATKITGKGFRHLPVLDHGKLVGMVSEMDILKKVIRA